MELDSGNVKEEAGFFPAGCTVPERVRAGGYLVIYLEKRSIKMCFCIE